MCDTFVALPSVTREKNVLFAKSADCEVNEANAIVRIPRKKHVKGESVRVTHLVIPQAEETYELFLTKAFWTYGCEVGINEYGLAMGEEAVFTKEAAEAKDGIIGPDLMRPFLAELAEKSDTFISCYPNAGLPNPLLPTGFPESPDSLAPQLKEWGGTDEFRNVIGNAQGYTCFGGHAHPTDYERE